MYYQKKQTNKRKHIRTKQTKNKHINEATKQQTKQRDKTIKQNEQINKQAKHKQNKRTIERRPGQTDSATDRDIQEQHGAGPRQEPGCKSLVRVNWFSRGTICKRKRVYTD